jgi:hypothetical protein
VLLIFVVVECLSVLLVMATLDLGLLGRLAILLALALAAVPLLAAAGLALGGRLAVFCAAAVAARAAVSAAYQTFFVHAAERLPTSHRGLGLGLGNGVSKSAAVVAPVALTWLMRAAPPAVCLLLIAAAVAAGAAILYLGSTETLGRALPDYPGHAPAAPAGGAKPGERTPLL